MDADGPVLVVGATGTLGGHVVDQLLAHGKTVRALVRSTSDAGRLEARGVQVVRGNMLDLPSLVAAMSGADAVISTAAGYTRGGKDAEQIDTVGNVNLARAAHQAGVRRFVLTSILTCDKTPDVPHFWHKKLTEDALEELGVPFVALRPGAFLDQVAMIGGNPVERGRITWMGSATTPLTFVLMSDLAGYLAQAVDASVGPSERIDIGWNQPVSMQEAARLIGAAAGTSINVRAIPTAVLRLAGATISRFRPFVADMAAMFRWFDTGRYVADTTRQSEVFGPPPTAVLATKRFADQLGSTGR